MIVIDGTGNAPEVQIVGGDGDHVILTVERPAVVETVEPGVLRLQVPGLVLIPHAQQRRTTVIQTVKET
jgi:hypothetical protein